MLQNVRTIINIWTKVNIFANHYAWVSKFSMSKVDRNINCTSKNNLALHLSMMKVALHFKWVSYLPLKRWEVKEQVALKTFLQLFLNHLVLWPSRNYYPYLIHHFLLITAQESRELPSSFHYWKLGNYLVKLHLSAPSVLHSVLPNISKRILADRLSHIAETKHLFSRFQAGFCKGFRCEDQIAGIVQIIEDGFQQWSMQYSLLTPLNFSKAYDAACGEKFLLNTLDAGIAFALIQ